MKVEIDQLDFASEMDMEISKSSFPYFFQNVLGYDYTAFHEEWLELMHDTFPKITEIWAEAHGWEMDV